MTPTEFAQYYRTLLPGIHDAIESFIISGEYVNGCMVEQFEEEVQEYLGAAYAVGCGCGTHALQLALLSAGIGHGDEVITVGNTYYATAWAIWAVGAKPVFCEVRSQDGLLDPSQIENLVTQHTRAILPVHLYGASAPLNEIRQIAKAHNLTVIEDCAHAFGSSYQGRLIGSDSEFACISFYPTKNLGAFGEAGMVLTRDKKSAEAVRRMRYFATQGNTVFDPRALHGRLDALQACLLSVVLRHFEEIAQRRWEFAKLYREALTGYVRLIPEDPERDVLFHVFPIFSENRSDLLAHLKTCDIHLQVHYPVNLHQLPEFEALPSGSLPITEKHNAEVMSLPVHPSLRRDEAERTCEAIRDYCRKNGRAVTR